MKDIAVILGIRPDVIRASKILKLLKESSEIDYDFIWSGQHYSENMKDVFFNQLEAPKPDYEFVIDTKNDSTTVSSIIKETYAHLDSNQSKAVLFVGDTNTDAEAAKNAQVHFIFCNYGHGSTYKLAKGENATIKIETFSDLISIYER